VPPGIQFARRCFADRQRWFAQHRTPPDFLLHDLSLREVAQFVPGDVDVEAEAEICGVIGTDENTECAAPDPNHQLCIHRITTGLVTRALGNALLIT
jgi:hypothetical protein